MSELDRPNRAGSTTARITAYPAGLLIGVAVWIIEQQITPVISNEVLDVFILPVVVAILIAAIIIRVFPKLRTPAACIPLGTLLFATAFYELVLH